MNFEGMQIGYDHSCVFLVCCAEGANLRSDLNTDMQVIVVFLQQDLGVNRFLLRVRSHTLINASC